MATVGCAADDQGTEGEGGMSPPNVTTLGRLLYLTGCIRFYRDGGGYGHLFRWWHPVSWVAWLMLLPVCGLIGEKVNEQVPFRLSPYWRARRDEIEWL